MFNALPLYWSLPLAILCHAQTPPSNQFPTGYSTTEPLVVDLGYGTYQGTTADGLNQWLGIPYAQAPIGSLRWQVSLPPNTRSNGTVLPANAYGYTCPQTPDPAMSISTFQPNGGQNEDCLVLNVWAPPNATNLPVFVWIHGGGYDSGSSQYDVPFMVKSAKDKFIGVAIQYRLGAFGFLSSEDVHNFGVVNAGLYDQYLALQWIQRYINLFGGNSSRVTLAGESAGAGSVMLQAMAYGGQVNDTLFSQIFAASPYLPQQFNYSDSMPTDNYYSFAQEAGCYDPTTGDKSNVFQCLVGQDTIILQNASSIANGRARFGHGAFEPTTDGIFIQDIPSAQLTNGDLNGKYALIGNNADEGEMFVPPNITTDAGFTSFVKFLYPLLDDNDMLQVQKLYPAVDGLPTTRYATNGLDNTTNAVNVSPFVTGHQQRANNLYAETTFDCPAQWLAEGFSRDGRQSYKYQYSILTSLHGNDLYSYINFSNSLPSNMAQTFRDAVISFINSFISTGSPSDENIYNTTVPLDTAGVLGMWSSYSLDSPLQMNLNQTGGTLTTVNDPRDPYRIEVSVYNDPGLSPSFSLVDAYNWEGGRGKRCDFWKSIGYKVPG